MNYRSIRRIKEMTEKQLELLEFEKHNILDEESDNGYDYHFYSKNVAGVLFLSCESDKTMNNDWWIYIENTPTRFKEFGVVEALFNVLKKVANEK